MAPRNGQTILAMVIMMAMAGCALAEQPGTTCRLSVKVTSDLPAGKVPMDPIIDFAKTLSDAGVEGRVDPNSIGVVNLTTGKDVECSLSDHFAHGDSGRVQWVISDPTHKQYEIHFRTAAERPPLMPRKYNPVVGAGDLVRHNAGEPRTFHMSYHSRMVDITGDGKRDLVGYFFRGEAYGWPWGGVFCHPRVGSTDKFEFSDLVRFRYLESPDATELKFFVTGYIYFDITDLNGDGHYDLICTSPGGIKNFSGSKKNTDLIIHVYLGTGKLDDVGMPIFVKRADIPHPAEYFHPLRAVDLDSNGVTDFVLGGYGWAMQHPQTCFLRNTNPKSWPFKSATPVFLETPMRSCFYDVDGDGLLDAVGLIPDPDGERPAGDYRVGWSKNLGGKDLAFGPAKMIPDIVGPMCNWVTAVGDSEPRGLLVTWKYYERMSFYKQVPGANAEPRFERMDPVSDSTIVMLGADPTPYPCDWDADGDMDILAGQAHGWIRLLINKGTDDRPSYALPRYIQSEGKIIHLFMSNMLPVKNYGHNLGYTHPVLIEWDDDELPDLMVPNLSNRMFWYKNIGAPGQPEFGSRQQVVCDGYPETEETLRTVAKLLDDGGKSPKDKTSPFGWRARAAFGDVTGDGLTDMIIASPTWFATLYVRYRDSQGNLKLREHGYLKYPDGSGIKASNCFLVDWDADGLMDLIVNVGTWCKMGPALLRNIGTKTEPKFDSPGGKAWNVKQLTCFGESMTGLDKHGPYYGVGDMDGDGKPDILATVGGKYAFFNHNAIEMKKRPETEITLTAPAPDARKAVDEKKSMGEIKKLRKQAAKRKRRIVFHSDGMPMNLSMPALEQGKCVFPHLPGTQTDGCTYSLVHQFPVVRLYRSNVGQEWPPGTIKEMYGDGPDGLEYYVRLCHKNGYEAFWAMRTNDTHDAGDSAHGLKRWNSNEWKKAHPELLVGSRQNRPPYAGWSAFDYAQQEVRDKVFQILEEVCRNYEIDGVLLDFFRHLPTFKSTAWGKEASDEERQMLSALLRRTRAMMDRVGAERGRPILLAVRTPDSPGYCKALGLDIEHWMREDSIDIWIATGYFRLQEWEETVKIGHKYGVPVWASMDESRLRERKNCNSPEAYRARIMNAWRAGVDAVWLFNFNSRPGDALFKLLHEVGDVKTLAHTEKAYVADARGRGPRWTYGLKGGERFFTRPNGFSPNEPMALGSDKPRIVNLRVGDDLASASADGFTPDVTLRIQSNPGNGPGDLAVRCNNEQLNDPTIEGDWINFALDPFQVKLGINQIEIARGPDCKTEPILHDLQLCIKYKR